MTVSRFDPPPPAPSGATCSGIRVATGSALSDRTFPLKPNQLWLTRSTIDGNTGSGGSLTPLTQRKISPSGIRFDGNIPLTCVKLCQLKQLVSLLSSVLCSRCPRQLRELMNRNPIRVRRKASVIRPTSNRFYAEIVSAVIKVPNNLVPMS